MTSQEYQKSLETDQPLIEFNGELKQMPFYLSPQNNEYPLDILNNLGECPIKITEEEFSLIVLYPGGKVEYIQHEGVLIPNMVRVFGATTQEGVQSLNTEHLDTLIYFDQVQEDMIDPNEEYLHFGDFHLQIDRIEGNNQLLKDWWISERKG